MTAPIHHVLGELSSFLDGKMSYGDRRRVEGHLQTCEECRRHCEDLSRLRKMVYPRSTHWREYIPFKTIGIALALVVIVLALGKVRKTMNLPKTPDPRKPAAVAEPALPPAPPKVVEKPPVEAEKPQVYIPPDLPIPPTTIPKPAAVAVPQATLAEVVPPTTTAPTPLPSPLGSLPQWQGSNSGIPFARTVTVQTGAEWSRLWQDHQAGRTNPSPLPNLDFNQVTVVGIYSGSRPSGGPGVEIYDVQTLSDQVVVRYRDTPTALPSTDPTSSTLQPYHLKAIPKTTLPVRFDRQSNRP